MFRELVSDWEGVVGKSKPSLWSLLLLQAADPRCRANQTETVPVPSPSAPTVTICGHFVMWSLRDVATS